MADVAQQVVDELEVLAEEREQMGPRAAADRPPEHFVITGNPGTGKTQLANILSEALAGIDTSRSADVAVFNAAQLSGYGYMGEAAAALTSFLDANPGKVILIDEAHTLADKDSYGRSVMRVIIPLMTQKGPNAHRFIFAGYPETEQALGDLDPGFASRISSTFAMPDYSTADLQAIARTKIVGDTLDPAGARALDAAVSSLPAFERSVQEKFANGRGVERLMDQVRKERLLRISRARKGGASSADIDWNYTAEDVTAGWGRLKLGPLKIPRAAKTAAEPAAEPKPTQVPSPAGRRPVPGSVAAEPNSYFGSASLGPEPNRRRKRQTI